MKLSTVSIKGGAIGLNYFFVLILFFAATVRAEKFDEFLKSLEQQFPMDTKHMRGLLEDFNTRLAHPSLLERWGIINSDAAASYNSVLNTVVLKKEYTIDDFTSAGKKNRRVKTILELQLSEPLVWSVHAQTIFHELSHAEFEWMAGSNNIEDIVIRNFLNYDFENYLREKHPRLNRSERKMARSELFAYFRADFLNRLIQTIDDVLVENGYFKTSKTCRNTRTILAQLETRPRDQWGNYILLGTDDNFMQVELPIVFVSGQDIEIAPEDPISKKLQNILWTQLIKHFAPAVSKSEIIRWMNSKSEFKNLIIPCRSSLLTVTKESN